MVIRNSRRYCYIYTVYFGQRSYIQHKFPSSVTFKVQKLIYFEVPNLPQNPRSEVYLS